MGIEDIYQALEKEGEKRVDEILTKAREETDQIVKKAEEEAKMIEEDKIAKAKSSLEAEKARLLNKARLFKKKEIIKAKEDYIQQAFDQAKEEIQTLRGKPVYKKVFTNLVREIMDLAKGKVTISVDKRDEKLAREVLDSMDAGYELKTDISCLGGVKAEAKNGRVIHINTLDARLDKARQASKADVTTVFFG